MELLSLVGVVEQSAGQVLTARSRGRAERARLYLQFQQEALNTLTQVEYVRAFGGVYRHAFGALWSWPHMLRSLDAVRDGLARLLIAQAAMETMSCPPPALIAAREFVSGLEDTFGALNRPHFWQRAKRAEVDSQWIELRRAAYVRHQRFQEQVAHDLRPRRGRARPLRVRS